MNVDETLRLVCLNADEKTVHNDYTIGNCCHCGIKIKWRKGSPNLEKECFKCAKKFAEAYTNARKGQLG
jgi:hypothetical protein